ncbi:MAG: shikimate kinase, partial [Hyphomicrobium sp.]
MTGSGDGNSLDKLKAALGRRSLVMVGLMGCGKSSVGKRLASRLGLPFVDADDEIVRAAGQSINEIFAAHGEDYFREGERKVIARILAGGPQVLATGGGAFMHPETRDAIRAKGISIWLRAELPVLMKRVLKRDTRPLLKTGDPELVMRGLMEARYPVYTESDFVIDSRDVPHDVIVNEILEVLRPRLSQANGRPPAADPTRATPSMPMSFNATAAVTR